MRLKHQEQGEEKEGRQRLQEQGPMIELSKKYLQLSSMSVAASPSRELNSIWEK